VPVRAVHHADDVTAPELQFAFLLPRKQTLQYRTAIRKRVRVKQLK
jgi:hypothetical protein